MGIPHHLIAAGLLASAWIVTPALVAPAMAAPVLTDGYSGTLVLGPTYFGEADVGTSNPSASFAVVPGYGALTISYGAYFNGQTYTFDPNDLAPPVLAGDTATAPLALADDPFLSALVQDDADAPANPVVGGSILGLNGFIGPVAVLFSVPVAAVQLTVGDLASIGQVTLEAFAADGSSLGSLANTGTGYEVFDLSSSAGAISGLSLRSTLPGDAVAAAVSGVGVYAAPSSVAVPAPGASALLLAALATLGLVGRRHHV